MRKMFLAALLAAAATPAVAAPDERPDRPKQARSERAERDDRPERAPARAERSQPRTQRDQRPQVRAESDRQGPAPVARVERSAAVPRAPIAVERQLERPVRVSGDSAPTLRVQRAPAESGDSVRDWRARERRQAGSPASIEERNVRRAPVLDRSGDGLVEQRRPVPPVLDRNPARVIRTLPTPGAEPSEPASARVAYARPSRHWRTDWRRDHRFDWRNHRRRNRSLFRLGFYLDPFGWGYHRYGIGWRMWPSHYSHRFWLNDSWSYRLPPAYGPYRWIRYWDDALLVNIYTGQVVDVVHNVFW